MGRTDYMPADQQALIDELPRYLRAEGFVPDLFFREEGGRGPGAVEHIVVFLGLSIASGLIGGAAWDAVKALYKWTRKRLSIEPPDAEAHVSTLLYGAEGALVAHIEIFAKGIEQVYIHPSIAESEGQ